MKKLTIIFCLMLLITGAKSNSNKVESYVIVGDETYFCDEIHVGPSSFRILTPDGDKMKISTAIIDAYSLRGALYEKLPVVNKNLDTTGWAYMQFISSRNGYKMYRYCSSCTQYDPFTGTIAPSNPIYRYYIFKNGRFITFTDDHNVKSLLSRFGVKLMS
ncbi:MAG: hypothetical protein HXX13_15900 [Bacteroidetes bacterium]|nr:hypothetical protein [Bacteroidota bacterium]